MSRHTFLSLLVFAQGVMSKRILVAYTRAAVINSMQRANHEIAEQINQGS